MKRKGMDLWLAMHLLEWTLFLVFVCFIYFEGRRESHRRDAGEQFIRHQRSNPPIAGNRP